eukprot:TRINITY_DN20648_c0_g1_i1.p1 TRINITY_DN20648_c0_g1~~TRINITY_DN20648_c0_g1_i1.p1  ORF type:complete len:625 (+),score=98.54 TRINITY_DN20648_c0_g1_i1:86-1876(+)
MNEIALLLTSIGLGHRIGRFDELEILSTETLACLTNEDFAELLPDDDERMRLQNAVNPTEHPPQEEIKKPNGPVPVGNAHSIRPQTAQPGVTRYTQLLKKKGELLKDERANADAIRALDDEISSVMKNLGFDVSLVRGDRVRIIGHTDYRLNGKVGSVIDELVDMDRNVRISLRNNRVVSVPPYCVQHVSETWLRPRRTTRPQWNKNQPTSYSTKPDAVRQAVERERSRREDPYTVYGTGTSANGSPRNSSKRVRIELVLLPEVPQHQIRKSLSTCEWSKRGLIPSSITYSENMHQLTFECSANPMLEHFLATSFDRFCVSRTVVRMNINISGTFTSPYSRSCDLNHLDISSVSGSSRMDLPNPNSPSVSNSVPDSTVQSVQSAASGGSNVMRNTNGGGTNGVGAPAREPTHAWGANGGHDDTRETPKQTKLRPKRKGSTSSIRRKGSSPSLNHSKSQHISVEEDLRVKLAASQVRVQQLQGDLSTSKAKEKSLRGSLISEKEKNKELIRESGEMKSRCGYLHSEMSKLSEALEAVMGTLSACGAQWAEQLSHSEDVVGSRMSRGVISELLATNHEISEKLRQLNILSRLAQQDSQ